MIPMGPIRRDSPGDNRHPMSRPEIVAAEQHILDLADAFVAWLKRAPLNPELRTRVDGFMAHEMPNPLRRPSWDTLDEKVRSESVMSTMYILDKLDPDANRFFFELIRAAWNRRCWQVHYGERANVHDTP